MKNYTKEKSIELAKKYQEDYNIFVTICENEKGKEGVLKNIPYALKDNYSTKDILTTGSSNILKDYVPFYNSTVYQKLIDSGAVLIGKTVLDELAMGGTSTTGHTGRVSNPWNKEYLIGGSSGGSAAAVAANIVPFALGSDTGDSVRKPASYAGIVGFKPTWGKISRYGLFPFACSLDTVAYFTRSVKDAALITDVLKGPDGKDMTVFQNDDVNISESLSKDVKGKKLFVIKELLDRNNYKEDMNKELDETLNKFENIIEKAKEIGIEIEEVSFEMELLKAIFPSYIVISCAEATSNNSNLTGIIFGPRGEGKTSDEIMFDARTKGFSELIKRRFVLGSYVLQSENQEKFFLNAGRVRRLIVDKMNELFDKYDGMILPASGGPAPKMESENIDRMSFRSLVLENNLIIGNFGGFPSITIPAFMVNDMPVGINITSKAKDDINVLNIAYALEEQINFKYLGEDK